jgi:hypothetical protein
MHRKARSGKDFLTWRKMDSRRLMQESRFKAGGYKQQKVRGSTRARVTTATNFLLTVRNEQRVGEHAGLAIEAGAAGSRRFSRNV